MPEGISLEEHLASLQTWLKNVGTSEASVKLDGDNVLYTAGNDCCGIPIPTEVAPNITENEA